MAAKNPTTPRINHLLNLPNSVTVTKMIQHENCDEVFVTTEPPTIRMCPHCGSNNCVIKDSGRTQTVRHTANNQRGVIVSVHKQRLYCKDCRVSFYERLDWLHPSLHMTHALWLTLCLDLTRMLSVATIAHHRCVTPSVVISVLDTIVCERPQALPETLCIDEFKGSSGEWNPERSRWDINKFHCNLSDGDTGTVIDVLPQIRSDFIIQYFRQYSPAQRMRVKYFCCDMHNGFISVAKELFPQARICIDMFHVIRLINDTVTTIRRRLQREMEDQRDKQKYALLKKASRSLLSSELKQEKQGNPNNAKRLDHLKAVFALFPELEEAYDALQEFHRINVEAPHFLKRSYLTDWIETYCASNIPELEKLARSIRRWRGYIQNTWELCRSNGTCEGLNNKIKVLKRVSFGLHHFENFRKRVLLTCGPIRLANDPFTIFQEKRSGKGIKL